MKSIIKVMLLSILVIILASCNSFTPQLTETPTPTNTSLPTSTSSPTTTPTSTPEPTSTPPNTSVPPTATPTESAPDLPMPSGTPSSEWEGVSIMPNALSGEGISQGYIFTINATSDEIQLFYENEMAKLGWDALASGLSATNATLMIFFKGANTFSVTIIPQPDGTMYVMLVK